METKTTENVCAKFISRITHYLTGSTGIEQTKEGMKCAPLYLQETSELPKNTTEKRGGPVYWAIAVEGGSILQEAIIVWVWTNWKEYLKGGG